MTTATIGILPETQGMPGLPGLGIYDPNGNRNTQYMGGTGNLQSAGLFAAQRYYFTSETNVTVPAVLYTLPNASVLFDFDLRWSARLVLGTGQSGSGRILFSATGAGGSASIVTAVVLMAPSPGPTVSVVLPGGAGLNIEVTGQNTSSVWDFTLDVDIRPN